VEEIFKQYGFRDKHIISPAAMTAQEIHAAMEQWSDPLGDLVHPSQVTITD